ncbi:iron-siderophore ABC transporter substrate-binding protein [Kribbella solani]|uniref:ABC transporter substrate-binding protein n=1 Tax=Kribbella solani TaxID=236067 RepID=UPI0029B09336|nr:iron-siderophore ABC transporter substrate-binding protein [Kribbella solani]MDX2968264.1 iron-siderophore ABC transporter substrate-binding protein [Kribbella solani]MDX3003094.1 iron-siderophore ABC transporter substrate-binding protein [Kribbella solani]
MRLPRIIPLLAAAALAATTLSACGSSGTDDKPGGGDAAAAGFPRTVEHAMGKTEIKTKPKRVVALDTSFVDATLILDTPVVGYTDYRTINGRLPDYLGDDRTKYGAEAKSVGTLAEPNLEKIAELNPDLIVTAKVRHEKLYDQLSAIAPTIMSETTGATWKENIRMEAKALGAEDLAEKEISAYEQAAKTVGTAINAKANDPTVSVVRFVDGPTRLYQNASFSGIVLKDAGLKRPKSQDVAGFALEISPERIKDADADAIFVTTYADEKGQSAKTAAQFKANPLWKPLAPKVHDVPDLTWMTAVGLQGAWSILGDLAKTFDVPAPAKPE